MPWYIKVSVLLYKWLFSIFCITFQTRSLNVENRNKGKILPQSSAPAMRNKMVFKSIAGTSGVHDGLIQAASIIQ